MAKLDLALFARVLALLVPRMRNRGDREALLLPVISKWPVRDRIEWEGDPRQFGSRLVDVLSLNELQTVLERLPVGVEDQEEIAQVCRLIAQEATAHDAVAGGPDLAASSSSTASHYGGASATRESADGAAEGGSRRTTRAAAAVVVAVALLGLGYLAFKSWGNSPPPTPRVGEPRVAQPNSEPSGSGGPPPSIVPPPRPDDSARPSGSTGNAARPTAPQLSFQLTRYKAMLTGDADEQRLALHGLRDLGAHARPLVDDVAKLLKNRVQQVTAADALAAIEPVTTDAQNELAFALEPAQPPALRIAAAKALASLTAVSSSEAQKALERAARHDKDEQVQFFAAATRLSLRLSKDPEEALTVSQGACRDENATPSAIRALKAVEPSDQVLNTLLLYVRPDQPLSASDDNRKCGVRIVVALGEPARRVLLAKFDEIQGALAAQLKQVNSRPRIDVSLGIVQTYYEWVHNDSAFALTLVQKLLEFTRVLVRQGSPNAIGDTFLSWVEGCAKTVSPNYDDAVADIVLEWVAKKGPRQRGPDNVINVPPDLKFLGSMGVSRLCARLAQRPADDVSVSVAAHLFLQPAPVPCAVDAVRDILLTADLDDQDVLPEVVKLVRSNTERSRIVAPELARLLGRMSPERASADQRKLANNAAIALRDIEPDSGKASVGPIRAALQKDWTGTWVQSELLAALRKLGRQAEGAQLDILKSVCQKPGDHVNGENRALLVAINPDGGEPYARALADSREAVQSCAVEVLTCCVGPKLPAVKELAKRLKNSVPARVMAAADALAHAGREVDEESREALLEALDRADIARVRDTLKGALAAIDAAKKAKKNNAVGTDAVRIQADGRLPRGM